jgi:anti-sigma B factor antagonist
MPGKTSITVCYNTHNIRINTVLRILQSGTISDKHTSLAVKGGLGVNIEHTDGGVIIITMPERLDAVGVSAIENQLSETITRHKGSKVLVDMSKVNFVASLALRMLLTNLKTAQAYEGGDLRLSGLQPQIEQIFHKSRFDTLFKIYPDREAALQSYQG